MPPHLLQAYALVEGATVIGPVHPGPQGRELAEVETICGVSPEAYRARTPFERLIAIDPVERFDLGVGGDIAMPRGRSADAHRPGHARLDRGRAKGGQDGDGVGDPRGRSNGAIGIATLRVVRIVRIAPSGWNGRLHASWCC